MLRPDAIYKCVKPYSGTTEKGEHLELKEGLAYFKTTTEFFIFICEYDDPCKPYPNLQPDEFTALEGTYLVKSTDL